MSSPKPLRRAVVLACLLALAPVAAACGGDEEGMQAAAEAPPADTSTTTSADESTAPSTTAPEQPARRKQRRTDADRKRRDRKKSTATETKPEPQPETAAESPPPEPDPEPEPEPEPEPDPTTPERSTPQGEDEPRVLHVVENATLKLVKREGITYWQEGTVKGTLSGTIAVKVTVGGPGVISTFTVTLPNGTIRGRGKAAVQPDGEVVHYNGTATITGGTGKFADASGRNLGYSGTGASDASTATARLTGKLRY